MSDLSVNISLAREGASATFIGQWTRKDIDNATRVMLRDLPKHTQTLRKEIEDGHSEQSTNTQRERTRKRRTSSEPDTSGS